MDIKLEKEKARYTHKLEIRKLVIDKIILGAIIVALAFVGNMLFEKYRSSLTEQRFFLEKKFDALNQVRREFSEMLQLFSFCTRKSAQEPPKDYQKKFHQSIEDAVLAVNSASLLLPLELEKELEFNIWIHSAIHFKDVAKCKDYREFVSYLFDQFMNSLKIEAGSLSKHSKKCFPFVEWSWEKTDKLGTVAFLEATFNKWKKWK